ncbi:MAG: hypothetical protein U0V87_15245 [Acidobacteriota bacterium]
MTITSYRVASCTALGTALLVASAWGAASAAEGVSLRRITDPSRGTTKLMALDGSSELATIEVIEPQAVRGCAAPLRLKSLALLRDLLAGVDNTSAHDFVRRLLGPFATTPVDLIPDTVTEDDVGAKDCTRKVNYRYNTCNGDCGTIGDREITCTCTETQPIECPRTSPFELPTRR